MQGQPPASPPRLRGSAVSRLLPAASDALVAYLADHDFPTMVALCRASRAFRALPVRTLVVRGGATDGGEGPALGLGVGPVRHDEVFRGEPLARIWAHRDRDGAALELRCSLARALSHLPERVLRGVTTLVLPGLYRGTDDPCPTEGPYAEHLCALRQLSAAFISAGATAPAPGGACASRLPDVLLRVCAASAETLEALDVHAAIRFYLADLRSVLSVVGPRLRACDVLMAPWDRRAADETTALRGLLARGCPRAAWEGRFHRPPRRPFLAQPGARPETTDACRLQGDELAWIREGGDGDLAAYQRRRRAWMVAALGPERGRAVDLRLGPVGG